MPNQGQSTYWRVKAIDCPRASRGSSPITDPLTSQPGRQVRLRLRQAIVSPPRPVGATPVDVPTLRWQPSQDAEQYQITMTGPGGNGHEDTSALSWTPPSAAALTPTRCPGRPDLFLARHGDRRPGHPSLSFSGLGPRP